MIRMVPLVDQALVLQAWSALFQALVASLCTCCAVTEEQPHGCLVVLSTSIARFLSLQVPLLSASRVLLQFAVLAADAADCSLLRYHADGCCVVLRKMAVTLRAGCGVQIAYQASGKAVLCQQACWCLDT